MSTAGNSPAVVPIAGKLGETAYGVDALAVSVTGTDLALLLSNRRTTLRRAPLATGQPSPLLTGVTDLLRPQFTRYGEIWAIGRQGGRQRMWMFAAEKSGELPGKLVKIPIDSPVLGNNNVTAFKISPDGTRMALVRRTGAGSELGLARIVRSERITVDEWRPLNTTQSNMPQIGRIADIGWLDATELLVLGVAAGNGALAPFRVAEDASRITVEGEPANWGDDAELTRFFPECRPQSSSISEESTWKYNGSQWLPIREGEAQHDRLSRLAVLAVHRLPDTRPIVASGRDRLGRCALSIGWQQPVSCSSAPGVMAAGSPGGASAPAVANSSPAGVLSSRLQFPAPMDSRSR